MEDCIGMISKRFIIGTKDIFKCFMMVLNYRAAVLSHEARRAECFNTADR